MVERALGMEEVVHAWRRWGAVALLGTLVLATTPSPHRGAAVAATWPDRDAGWFTEDLAAAERVGALLDENGLGVENAERAPMGASLRDARAAAPAALATFPARALGYRTGAAEIAVESTASGHDLLVEVRGRRADGHWTEWRGAPSPTGGRSRRVVLPVPVDQLQVRIGLGPSAAREDARVSAVRLRPRVGAAERRALPAEPFSARLYATRIGREGEITANGHEIRVADRFAALPSRRPLAARDGGEYVVRVCGEQRCAYVPVWDVGPWNVKDDHWNARREMWTDLPRGKPQAQAAYEESYNGGVDGFARDVLDPAGIDLADGTFQEVLGAERGGWVDVDYLWTGRISHPVHLGAENGGTVELRSQPRSGARQVGSAASGVVVDVACRVHGDEMSGPRGTEDEWYRLAAGEYVPAVFAEEDADVEVCGTAGETTVPDEAPPHHAPLAPAGSVADDEGARRPIVQ
ncbi:hypothetical protein ACQEU5_12000 [Marinactinospora thermotolerans]|uniref:hypothetical protein n=1 Tax=Marinactinospora thermotolerans TaxID=531310 RepID=UPI003D8FF6CC